MKNITSLLSPIYGTSSDLPVRAHCTPQWCSLGQVRLFGAFFTSWGKKVLFVCPPQLGNTVQQQMVRQLIENNYSHTISYINLGDALDLSNDSLCYDGLHLTREGNYRVAQLLEPRIRERIGMPSN